MMKTAQRPWTAVKTSWCILQFVLLASTCYASDEPERLSSNQHVSATLHVKYWDWGMTSKRDNYQFELLRQALEITRDTHGDYILDRVVRAYSTPRVRREIHRGDIINIRIGPWRPQTAAEDAPNDANVPIPIPIAMNLLGYRELIVHKEALADMGALRDDGDFTQQLIGQGRGWEDIRIYRANGYRVDDSANFMTLVQMLNNRRFDILAVSVIETDTLLRDPSLPVAALRAVPDVMFFYEFPLIYYTSPHTPELTTRVTLGLQRLMSNGAHADILHQYFAEEIQRVQDPRTRIIELHNPLLSTSQKTLITPLHKLAH